MVPRIPIRKAALRVRIVEAPRKAPRVRIMIAKLAHRAKPAPLDPELLDPDYVARKIIVHAFLYYVLDAPVISDHEYDRYCCHVADNWDDLHPDRQWALGSPRDIRSTGYHVKFSSMAVGAALNHHKYATGELLESPRLNDPRWQRRKKDGVHYLTTAFHFDRDN